MPVCNIILISAPLRCCKVFQGFLLQLVPPYKDPTLTSPKYLQCIPLHTRICLNPISIPTSQFQFKPINHTKDGEPASQWILFTTVLIIPAHWPCWIGLIGIGRPPPFGWPKVPHPLIAPYLHKTSIFFHMTWNKWITTRKQFQRWVRACPRFICMCVVTGLLSFIGSQS